MKYENIRSNALNGENILYQMPGICFWKDRNFRYHGGNKELLDANGFSSLNDIIGRTDYELLPFYNDADKYTEQDRFTLKGNVQFNIAMPELKEGKKGVHLIKKGPIFNENKEIVGVAGIGFQLTQENFKNIFSLLALSGLKFSDFISTIEGKDPIFSYGNLHFTKREAQVLSNLLRGNTASSTSKNIFLSRKTVEHYLEKIKNKLECKNKSEILNKAFECGFIDLMFVEVI